jgi:predicted nucleic acid-binding Zn finger protein
MAKHTVTPSMTAKAVTLLEERNRWHSGRSKLSGLRFWLMPSSDRTASYTVGRDTDFCSCRSWLYRSACSHVEASRMARGAERMDSSELDSVLTSAY